MNDKILFSYWFPVKKDENKIIIKTSVAADSCESKTDKAIITFLLFVFDTLERYMTSLKIFLNKFT